MKKSSNVELIMKWIKSLWFKKIKTFLREEKKKKKCKKAKSLAQTISQHAISLSLRSLYLNNKINLSQISLSKVFFNEIRRKK